MPGVAESLGKWLQKWRKKEGFCWGSGVPLSLLTTVLRRIPFSCHFLPGWHLILFAWNPGPSQPKGKQVYKDLSAKGGKKASEPGNLEMPALGLGKWKKAPMANQSLGAKPQPSLSLRFPASPLDKHGSEACSLPLCSGTGRKKGGKEPC